MTSSTVQYYVHCTMLHRFKTINVHTKSSVPNILAVLRYKTTLKNKQLLETSASIFSNILAILRNKTPRKKQGTVRYQQFSLVKGKPLDRPLVWCTKKSNFSLKC